MNKKLILINESTLESLEVEDILEIIEIFTKTSMSILSADFGFMFWKQESREPYKLIYKSEETPYQPKLPRRRGYNYKASMGRIPYFVSNPKKDLLPYMKSLAIIPIFYKNHQYGNIVLCYKEKHIFDLGDAPLSMTLSNSMAHVLTIYKSHKKIERNSQKLLKQKDEFFNIISHELRTPVTTIKGFTQILTEKLNKQDKNNKYFLDKINSQADKLNYLINDLLDVSSIEKGKMQFKKETFELQTMMQQLTDDLQVALPSNQISFKPVGKFWVQGDSIHISRVIINLIKNAAKYSPPHSKINVSLRERHECAYVEVEDFGYGIKERDHSRVFKKFFQSKQSTKRKVPGLGLGLYIAKTIIKNHKGEIDFRNKKSSKGTVFCFTLPHVSADKK